MEDNLQVYNQIKTLLILINSHLIKIHEQFELEMQTRIDIDGDMLINMFYAINDLVSEISFLSLEEENHVNTKNELDHVKFRKKIMTVWNLKSKLHPLPYITEIYQTDLGDSQVFSEECQKKIRENKLTEEKNNLIAKNVLSEFKRLVYRNRWEQVKALINEIRMFHVFH